MPITIARLLVEIGANSDAARAELASIGGELQGYGDQMMRTGALMTAGLSVPLALLGKKVTDLAQDYQENMNVLGAVTNATGAQMSQLGTLAQQLGADLTLPSTSAGDAASAMVELGKAGLDVIDVMGAARGVLELSAAGNLENARAAEVTSNALNAFNLAGTEATHVADLLAAGANTSSAEVEDMADGMQMASAVFAASGRPIEDMIAMLAEMANAGIKGSDAGTSLKQMFLSLQAPTDKARSLMEEYGIEIYDANGAMLSSEDIIGNFSDSLSGMSEAQRNAALATIFGSDAVRAANVVLMSGRGEFQTTKGSVDDFGAAARLAAARVEGLPGSLLAMENSLQTLGTNLGNAATKPIAELAETVTNLANAFAELPEGTQEMIIRLGMLAIAAGPTLTVLGGITKAAGGLFTGISAASKGIQAFRSGLTVTSALGAAGITPFAATFGAIAAAAAAAGTAVYLFNRNIVETNRLGNEAIGVSLNDYYQGIINNGGQAGDVLAGFTQQQQMFNQQISGAGIAGGFVNQNALAETNLRQLSAALLQTTGSAAEYEAAMMKAYEATGLASSSREWIYAERTGTAYATLVKHGVALSATDYELARAQMAAGSSARDAANGIQGMGNAAVDGGAGLIALSAEAEGYMSQLDLLGEAQQSLNTQMSDWVQNAASEAQASLSGLNEKGTRYLEGLKAIDEVMGTNYFQQQDLKNSMDDLGAEYQKTGDLDAYKEGLQRLKEEGMKPFQEQLADVTLKAQTLYDKLTNMPEEVLINVNFNVNGEPNWAGLGIDMSGNPGGVVSGNTGVTAISQASGGDWWVTKPTLFLAGDAGAERATFTPAGKTVDDTGVSIVFQEGAIQVAAKNDLDVPWLARLMAANVAQEIRRRRL